MRWRSPRERSIRRRRVAGWVVAAAAAVAVVSLLDHAAYRFFKAPPETEIRDWFKMLRIVGYFPAWILIGLGVDLAGARGARRISDGVLLMLSSGLAGGAAEILKLVVGRERPGPDGEYVYRGIFGGFTHGGGLGMPSSHAAVAFGGAFMLAWLRPGTGPVILAAAVGCALTRLLGADHFLSDVTVGAMVAYAVSRVIAGAAGVLPKAGWRYG